jgi:spermidine synthase
LRRWLLALLCVLFFFSGCCALIYQVMWLRMLALVFGVTVYAASTVLASFMGGLAIGSFAAGRVAGRLRRPLAVFGAIEVAIGLSALATPLLLTVVKGIWVTVQPSLPASLPLLTVARFVASFAILIIPTTLMGATLPVVMRSALVQESVVASRIGLLYAVNTGGAICGALIAGFYLLAEVGMARSFQAAAIVNVIVGAIALVSSRRAVMGTGVPRPGTGVSRRVGTEVVGTQVGRTEVARTEVVGTGVSPGAGDGGLSASQQRAVVWTFAMSGMMSLALEIVWFRMLVTMLRPTAYAFTIMLAAVLAGIAFGSAAATLLLRRQRSWLPVLTAIQLLIAITAVLSLNGVIHLQRALEWIGPPLATLGIDPYLGPLVAASLLAMLPTTLLLGFAFPIGLSIFASGAADSARRIGSLYSVNVFGAIAGSVLGGFLLLPTLGSRGSLIATSSAALLSSVLLALAQWRTRPNFAGFTLIVGPVAFAMASLNAVNPYAVTANASERVMWRQEGVQTTVGVHESGAGGRPHRIMYLDGMHQASDLPAMAFVHHRIGGFPMLLHPHPANALVVGLGGGATAGAVAQFPGVSVDVVELSGAVVRGAAFFSHINFDLLTRPNVQLRVDDGRNYLLTTRKKYDVITADIILPRHAGAGALYSREYFELVRDALNDDGLVLQWNGGEGAVYNLILRTFVSVFPQTTLWADGTLMLGSKKPFEFSRSAYEQRRTNPEFRKLFDWTYDQLIEMYVAGPPDVVRAIGDEPILTDDKPVIEYFLSIPQDEQALDVSRLPRRPSDIVRP